MTSPCPHKTQTPYTWNFTLRTRLECRHQGGQVNLPLPPDRPLLYPATQLIFQDILIYRSLSQQTSPEHKGPCQDTRPTVHPHRRASCCPQGPQPAQGPSLISGLSWRSSLRRTPRVWWAKLEKKLSWGSDQCLGLNLSFAGPEIQVFGGSKGASAFEKCLRGNCGSEQNPVPHFQWGNLFPMARTLLPPPRALLLKAWPAGQEPGSSQNRRPPQTC